ncbi:MAG: hypothetical protein JNL08_00040 [Planctomycetes bacterium]|nr:hypothetical protein [Planctomycetota bacterium]
MRRTAWVGCAGVLLTVSMAAQQEPLRAVRVVLADGTPMPGVPVHVVPMAPQHGDEEFVDGWYRPSHWHLRRLRAAATAHSDPDGIAAIAPGPDQDVFVGAPFAVIGDERDGAHRVLRVERLARYSVRALDHEGTPLRGFGLTLRAGDQVRAVALTDADGNAVFGVEPTLGMRVQVVPFGWIGPTEDLPMLPDARQQKHGTLRLPPFGTVRVRTCRDGAPVPFHGQVAVHTPQPLGCFARPTPAACGVELWPVAVGTTLRGELWSRPSRHEFTSAGPQRAGDVAVVDIELDPARAPGRAQLTCSVAVPDVDPPRCSLQLTAVSDAGTWFALGRPDRTGRLQVEVEHGNLGGVLRRVDVFVEQRRPDGTWRAYAASLPFDRPITEGTVDLGMLPLQPFAGVLRGRVVTEDGRPVPLAEVRIAAGAPPHRSFLRAQEDGTFEWVGPPLRAANGDLLPLQVEASKGAGTLAAQSGVQRDVAQGSSLTLVLPPVPTAQLTVRLRADAALPWQQLQFVYVDAAGRRHALEFPLVQRCQGETSVLLGPLPAGPYRLCLVVAPGLEVHRTDELQLPADAREPVPLDLPVPPAAVTCRQRCVDAAGLPIVGAVAVVRAPDGSVWRSDGSDTDGWLRLAAGSSRFAIRVEAPGFAPLDLAGLVDGAELRFAAAR